MLSTRPKSSETTNKGSDFGKLRSALYGNLTELRCFRQLFVNSVIATDIFDKEQGILRKNRWNKAFGIPEGEVDQENAKNRKATVVIEFLIQGSDVTHCMAHWAIYQKW